ncbi:MAG TPA: GIY-YIG nuclease family protein [Stellaceae bacterium]
MLNTVYWQAIIDAIAAGHSTVAAITDFAKNDARYAHVPTQKIRDEIRHNVGRGYYQLVRDEEPGGTPSTDREVASAMAQQPQIVGFSEERPAKPLVVGVHDMRLPKVDTSKMQEFGEGLQSVYVYGFDFAPNRLKIGKAEAEPIKRVASQITTATPGIPTLFIIFHTDDCHNLEKAMHRILSFRQRKVVGGGDEWFHTNCDELIEIFRFCLTLPDFSSPPDVVRPST